MVLAPKRPETHVLLALNHARKEDISAAESEIEAAVAAGLPRARADALSEQLGINASRRHWMYAKIAGVVLVAWLVVLALVFLAGLVLSRLTFAEIDRYAGSPEKLAHNTRWLRKSYAVAIAISAAYYFISIPVLIVVVLVGAGALLYGILMVGRIPIKLVLLIVIGAAVSVWAMLKSLFSRPRPQVDLGQRLREDDAPRLWELLREVARKVGTRTVDKVFMTVGTDLAVIERGKLSARLRDRGERVLLLGAGVLGGLSVHQLRAILAHEYGHFSNRDTAGGDVAMTVNASLLSTAMTLAQSGVSPFNPTWQFLRLFSSLFERITRGASRLQEVMADQFAALAYGAPAFCAGLEMVIRRSVQFDFEVDHLVKRAEGNKQPIHNLYVTPTLDDGKTYELEAAIQKVLAAPGSAYDSHPPPQRRMDLVRRSGVSSLTAAHDEPAWSLFRDQSKLQSVLTEEVNETLRERGIIGPASSPWPETGALGYAQKPTGEGETILNSAEACIAHLEANPPVGSAFHLLISSAFTFAGQPDSNGMGMALVMDMILGLGYGPNGFEQQAGFRIYRYTKISECPAATTSLSG